MHSKMSVVLLVTLGSFLGACSSGDSTEESPATTSDAGTSNDSGGSIPEDGAMPEGDAQATADGGATDSATTGDSSVPAGDGLFAKLDGVAKEFKVSQNAELAYTAGAGSPLQSALLSAGDMPAGATLAVKMSAIGANTLTPGTYPCEAGKVHLVQYMKPGMGTYQAVGASGTCMITLTSAGASVGERFVGSFTATLVKVGGSEMITVTDGTFSVLRN